MTSSTRALAWMTLLLLLAAYCCGVTLANKHLPPWDRAPGPSPRPRAWHEREDRVAPERSLLGAGLDALRVGRDSYATYRDWVFSCVEQRAFRTLQEQTRAHSSLRA